MGVIGGFWTSDPRGKHAQRYWDGHTWTSYVSDFGFTSRDPLPAGTAYPSPALPSPALPSPALPPTATAQPPIAVAPAARPAPAIPLDERRLIVGIPAHVAASLLTAGGWLLVIPVIALWRRGSRPLAASWAATVILVVVAAALLTGRLPEAATMQASAFADDGSQSDPPQLVTTGIDDVDDDGTESADPPSPDLTRTTVARGANRSDAVAASIAADLVSPSSSTVTNTTAATPTPTSTAAAPTASGPTAPLPTTTQTPAVTSTSTTSATGPPATSPPAISYETCSLLILDHPYGVGSPGSIDLSPTGEQPISGFEVDGPLYLANSALDDDSDGIACERG